MVNGLRVLEFERLDRLVSPELTNAVLANFVGKLSKLRTERELCQAITRQVLELTGFNRVMLYRFDETGCGTVLTEERDEELPSYLDLRFPASDIPQQARALYLTNTMRIIPDAHYVPSPLRGVEGVGGGGTGPVAERAAERFAGSPGVHAEHGDARLRCRSRWCARGDLWGLISAHHADSADGAVPGAERVRLAGEDGEHTVDWVCGRRLRLETMVNFHAVQRKMLTQMAAENNYLEALADQIDEMVRVTGATGVALVMDGRFVRGG